MDNVESETGLCQVVGEAPVVRVHGLVIAHCRSLVILIHCSAQNIPKTDLIQVKADVEAWSEGRRAGQSHQKDKFE